MFEKVLIANRGEIALRIHRACRDMGIKTVAVHSTADANAMNVRLADESVCIGPPPARQSYLNIPAILSAATITGADAIHPVSVFVRERRSPKSSPSTASPLSARNPSIRVMGKVQAKAKARSGIPTLPGSDGALRALRKQTRHEGKLPGAAKGGFRRRRPRMKLARERPSCERCCRAQKLRSTSLRDNSVYLELFLTTVRAI